MVLRGSAVVPDSLEDAQNAVDEAQAVMDQAKLDLAEAQATTLHNLSAEEMKSMSKRDLIILVMGLKAELSVLQDEHDVAEQHLTEKRAAVVKTISQLAAGGTAGAIARTTVAPIDRVKILMQTSAVIGIKGSMKYYTIAGSMRNIIQSEGTSGLWKGNFTNCLRVVPHTATQFVAYEKYKSFLIHDGVGMDISKRLLTGAFAGITAASITHPLDVVRIRLQTRPDIKTAVEAMRHVYAEKGIRSFYKGYTPAMLSLSPFIAINFATFDILKTSYYGKTAHRLSKKELQKSNPGVILVLGAASGLIAQTCCYPLDTVRRRMQVAGTTYCSTPSAFRTIARVEGIRGFYTGMVANALKVAPNNAVRQ